MNKKIFSVMCMVLIVSGSLKASDAQERLAQIQARKAVLQEKIAQRLAAQQEADRVRLAQEALERVAHEKRQQELCQAKVEYDTQLKALSQQAAVVPVEPVTDSVPVAPQGTSLEFAPDSTFQDNAQENPSYLTERQVAVDEIHDITHGGSLEFSESDLKDVPVSIGMPAPEVTVAGLAALSTLQTSFVPANVPAVVIESGSAPSVTTDVATGLNYISNKIAATTFLTDSDKQLLKKGGVVVASGLVTAALAGYFISKCVNTKTNMGKLAVSTASAGGGLYGGLVALHASRIATLCTPLMKKMLPYITGKNIAPVLAGVGAYALIRKVRQNQTGLASKNILPTILGGVIAGLVTYAGYEACRQPALAFGTQMLEKGGSQLSSYLVR